MVSFLHKEWTEAGVKASRQTSQGIWLQRRLTWAELDCCLGVQGPLFRWEQLWAKIITIKRTRRLGVKPISLSYPFPFVLPLAPRNRVVSARGENIPLWYETPLGYCYVIIHCRLLAATSPEATSVDHKLPRCRLQVQMTEFWFCNVKTTKWKNNYSWQKKL